MSQIELRLRNSRRGKPHRVLEANAIDIFENIQSYQDTTEPLVPYCFSATIVTAGIPNRIHQENAFTALR